MLELDDQNHDVLVDCTMQSETVFKETHTDVTAATGSTVVLPYNPGSLYDQLEVGMYVFVEFHGAKKIRGAHYAGCIIEKVNVLYPEDENVAEHPVDSVALVLPIPQNLKEHDGWAATSLWSMTEWQLMISNNNL